MNKIIHYSKKTVPANAKENAGELLIKCNLEEMKKWSYIQISEIFDSQGNLKGHFKQMKGKIKSSNANDPGSRVDLIRGLYFRWLNIKGIDAAFHICMTLFSNHLK